MSNAVSPPSMSVGKRILVAALVLASGAFFVLVVGLSVMHAQEDSGEYMRRANEVALELAALEPTLRAASHVPELCPKDLRPHRATDPEDQHPPPVVDAQELLRFAPPDAGRTASIAPGSKPGSKGTWRFSYRELADLTPWEDPRHDREARLSNSAAKMFERGYVIVVETIAVEDPEVHRALVGDDAFVPGKVRGTATLFDLDAARPLCRASFEARNSPSVEWRQGNSYAEHAVHDNLEVRTEIAAADAISAIAPALKSE